MNYEFGNGTLMTPDGAAMPVRSVSVKCNVVPNPYQFSGPLPKPGELLISMVARLDHDWNWESDWMRLFFARRAMRHYRKAKMIRRPRFAGGTA